MIENFLIAFGFFWVGYGLAWIGGRARAKGVSVGAEIVGICMSALDQSVRKEGNKRRVLELIAERGEISNSDIREALEVSGSTVVRYLDELERAGKVVQVGETGQSVVYRLK